MSKHTQTQTNPYRVVSVEEGAATFIVWHTGSLTHDKTSRTLAPFNAVGGVAFGGRRQVRAGGRARCHTRSVRAVGTAGQGWEERECAPISRLRNDEQCCISINCTYLTTAELLPPGSQRDSFVLAGGGVRLITGTAQLLAATLSTQVKQAVPEVGVDVLVF